MGVTEVPDYLLERSRARRAALGLATPGGPAPSGDAAPAGAPAPAVTGAPPAVQPAEAAGAPAQVAAATGTIADPAPVPPVAASTGPRSGIPVWMMPVILLLPFWAVIYLGSFATPKAAAGGPVNGGAVYASNCVSCHGAQGQGGVGPKLSGGEAKLTFPDEADHVKWVQTGSAPSKGKPYGDPNRPGGPHTAASGGMPAFTGTLSPEQIQAVVTYEREKL